MLPTDYDLRYVHQQYDDLGRQAAETRKPRAARATSTRRRPLTSWIWSMLSALDGVRLIAQRAQAIA